jgi:hypothetical protein
MKYVNDDARPTTVINENSFYIEDTKHFGTYTKGGVCEKVDLVEKIKFLSFILIMNKGSPQLSQI